MTSGDRWLGWLGALLTLGGAACAVLLPMFWIIDYHPGAGSGLGMPFRGLLKMTFALGIIPMSVGLLLRRRFRSRFRKHRLSEGQRVILEFAAERKGEVDATDLVMDRSIQLSLEEAEAVLVELRKGGYCREGVSSTGAKVFLFERFGHSEGEGLETREAQSEARREGKGGSQGSVSLNEDSFSGDPKAAQGTIWVDES